MPDWRKLRVLRSHWPPGFSVPQTEALCRGRTAASCRLNKAFAPKMCWLSHPLTEKRAGFAVALATRIQRAPNGSAFLRSLVCLFVCLVHGIPVVCGGRRLTKDGPYATRRQAEAVLFVRRKPTPPFAGCQGNLLFRGSRGLQTGRPVDHRPYSARHVGLKVESFGNNKPCAPRPPQMVGISRCASTPRQHTVEVCASQGPQQARPSSYQCPVVGASHRCTCAVGPSGHLCFLGLGESSARQWAF